MSSENPPGPAGSELAPEVAIRTRGLTKVYSIYARPGLRLKQFLWPGGRKFYQDFVAVRDIDLEIHRGETVGIVGRNGSGKSTLLNLICGTLPSSSGELEVSGHVAPILTLGAGFDPDFTGRENVLMNAAIIGLSRTQISQRMDSIVDFAGIGDFFDRPVKLYSSGMYARLAFAVAINADPEILVIDEILSVGDEAFARKCFARLEELKEAGSTILFVSHSSQMVIELCDRALLIEAGERLLTASPKEVVAAYHKLLYASEASRADVIQEIRQSGRGGSAGGGSQRTASEKAGAFDSSLVPESSSEYERLGAVIERVCIENALGEQVNVLERGGEYTYTYEVSFSKEAYGVQFGMMIKAGTGLEIAGQVSHGPGEVLDHVNADERVRVALPFRADLVAGTYFMNAGVMAVRGGEKIYLHRIIDALLFRVAPVKDDRVTGRVDLKAGKGRVEILPGD